MTRRANDVWRSRSRRRPGAGRRSGDQERGRRSLGELAQLLDQGVLFGRPAAGVAGPGQALSCQLRSCRGGRDGIFQGHRGGSLGQRLVASAPDRPFLVDVGPAAPRAPRAAGALGADALGASGAGAVPPLVPWPLGLRSVVLVLRSVFPTPYLLTVGRSALQTSRYRPVADVGTAAAPLMAGTVGEPDLLR